MALWQLGLRPFYLLAAIFAALAAPLWALEYTGWLRPLFHGPAWHAHEMLFGFAFAVVAGFLLTAVRNWTQRPTPTGAPLAALALLWLAGRVAVFAAHGIAAALVDAAFPLAVAVAIAIPLARSGNRRNYFFVALLGLAAAAALMFHLAALGLVEWPQRASLQVALDVMLFLVAVIGGRVIPMFTNNAIPGAAAARMAWVEKLALGSVLAMLAADLLEAPATAVAIVAGVGAIAHAARLALWRPQRTLRTPMVWVLHAAYAWIPVHFALRALAQFDLVPASLATHALTIGVIGGMTIGMMTRTARGHTGRSIVADRGETVCFALVQAAAIVRVLGGLLVPSLYAAGVVLSSLLWSAAFGIYAVSYWPVLTKNGATYQFR